ncbi:MAG: peptidylprolyl isomerase [Candidatus Accumulibacter sp.]|jgi:peptidyl-prolyl cis-trans isomerase SurA|nr:peptidylprolyl isomerase [Accumulibacter sp.]
MMKSFNFLFSLIFFTGLPSMTFGEPLSVDNIIESGMSPSKSVPSSESLPAGRAVENEGPPLKSAIPNGPPLAVRAVESEASPLKPAAPSKPLPAGRIVESGMSSSKPVLSGEPLPADRIVAVVNDEVITALELRSRLDMALKRLEKQKMEQPPRDVLEKQMLERLIMDRVQLQRARETGIRVDDIQLEQAIQRIAAGNNMPLAQFVEALQKDGISFPDFREELRNEMIISRLREREVENKIIISEGEIDNYLSGNLTAAEEEYEIAHILLRAPESASPEQIRGLQSRAEKIRERLDDGEDFAKMAVAYSDAPDGLQGGYMGKRPLNRLPNLFAEIAVRLKGGEVSPLLRSPNGFHIVKLISKTGRRNLLPAVQQTRVRHILIRVNELVSESEARHRLDGLYERIRHGGNFAELARLYSQDGTATKGGDLGWVYPGDTVPEFEHVMDRLKPGELSPPIQTPFGFHLIEVLERRVQDVSADRQRAAARQALRERKFDEAYQDWLRQERDSAYIEIRLDENPA